MLALLVVAAACAASVQGDAGVVQIADGLIQGVVSDDVVSFLGIPYATPPLGELRWGPSTPNQPWAPKVLQATAFGPGCPQNCNLPPHSCPPVMSEDCLTLNVWSPRTANGSLPSDLPVMVFFHGGRFEQGASGTPLYNASYMATSGNVVMVTANYRMGVLGWLVTSKGGVEGNFGIHDQREVLRWVQKNIAAFGGNPSKVTLFGQSAGAGSTAVHLISPNSAGLFQSAIVESNPFVLRMKTTKELAQLGDLFLTDLGCPDTADVLTCLRNASIPNILAAQKASEKHIFPLAVLELFLPWTPATDGKEVPMQPMEAFVKGKWNKMPLMMGTVKQEAFLFIHEASAKPVDEKTYLELLAYLFKLDAPGLIELYPPFEVANDTRTLLSTMGTDYMFVCTGRVVARAVAAANIPIYWYQFDHVMSFDAWGPNYEYCVGVVCHGSELPFLFHTVEPFFNMTAAEAQMSTYLTNLWTNFAWSHNPNTPVSVSPQWPAYAVSADQHLAIDTPSSVQSGLRSEFCDHWDKIGYNWGT